MPPPSCAPWPKCADGSKPRPTTRTESRWCWKPPWPRFLLQDNERSSSKEIELELRVTMRSVLFIPVAVLAALATLAPATRAAERVTLRNGFEMNCAHHAPVDSHIRLYLSAGNDNYIDFNPQEIVAFEQVPDPPPPTPSQETATAPATKVIPDAKLSAVDV